MMFYFILLLFIFEVFYISKKREFDDIFIKNFFFIIILHLSNLIFKYHLKDIPLVILSSGLIIFFFNIRITRSIFLIIHFYIFFENTFYFFFLLPIITITLIKNKNYFYICYLLFSTLHIYILINFGLISLTFPSIIFIIVNIIMSNSDFTLFHPISTFFLKNYYVAELILKNSYEEKTLLQTLPSLAALNLSYRKGNFEIKYILKSSKNKKKVEKYAHQNITRIKALIGDVHLNIYRLDFKKNRNLKFYDCILEDSPENTIDFFNTLTGEILCDLDLYICYKDLKFDSSLTSYNPPSSSNSTFPNYQTNSNFNTQKNLTEQEQEDKICKARVILSVNPKSTNVDYRIIKNKIRALDVKRRFYLYNLIIFKRILLNKLILASDYPSTKVLVQKAIDKEFKSVNYAKHLHKENRLLLGNLIENGIETTRPYYIEIDALTKGARIIGEPGTGKTFELAHIIKEIKEKRPNVGMLVINLTKSGQYKFYQDLEYLRLEDFKIPYFPPNKEVDNYDRRKFSQLCYETARYIAGALGLKNVLQKILQTELLKKYQTTIPSLEKVINLIIDHLKENSYSNSLNKDLIMAVTNRRDSMAYSKFMDFFSNKNTYPKWFIEWLNGKSFFVELDVSKDIQRFAIFALLNLIRFKREDQEISHLKNMIFIDEAHRLTSSSPERLHANDDELVTLNLQSEILSNLLNEYRYQGISMMLSDQRAEALDYANNVGLKMYFKSSTSHSNNEYIDEETLKMITHLKKRHVILHFEDEEVLIKTPDFYFSNIITGNDNNSQNKKDKFKIIYNKLLDSLSS